MVDGKATADGCDHKGLRALQSALLEEPVDADLVRAYYDAAVSSNRIDAAIDFFQSLLEHYPDHQQIRTLFVALCLQNRQYATAMEAIETLLAVTTPEAGFVKAALKVRRDIGPKKIEKKRKAGVTLSVCMIVRDEQDYLGPCLQSIKLFADEIVVVDTGSTDRTVDIARIFGAKVYGYKWNDDFAAARNYGLERANGDWVLVMDADEIISNKDQINFLNFCQQLSIDERLAFNLTTLNYSDQRESAGWIQNDNKYPEAQGDGWVPTDKVRLFPNHNNIRFVYPVHEVVDPVLKKNGYRVKQCPIPILHFGKLNYDRKRERWQTYYRIGRKKLNHLGDHPSALRELAVQAALLNRLDEACDLWERYIQQRPNSINGWTNLASVYSRLGRYPQATKAAQKAAELAPDKVGPLYNLVISDLQSGDAFKAAKDSKRLLDRFPDYVQGHILAAISHVCSGQLEIGVEMLRSTRQKVADHALIQMIAETSAPIRDAGYHSWIKDIGRAIEHTC